MSDLRTAAKPLPRSVGWAVVGALAFFVAAGVGRRTPEHPALAALAACGAVGFGALAVLSRRTLVLVPAITVASAAIAVLANGTASNIAWFGLPVLAGWCALWAPFTITIGYWGAAMLLLGGEALFTSHDPGWAAWIGGTCFSVVGCLFGRRQRDLVAQLQAAQEGLAARAQAEERNRIAREVHDVIAHTLTVSLLHVSSARLALEEDHDEAVRALEEAERLGRQSLDEVRHTVGLMRGDAHSSPTTPLPSGVDVPDLVDSFRSAGADIRSTIEGDLGSIPRTVGLATYRITQEALTNVAKHAPHSRCVVHLAVQPRSVDLQIDSSGMPREGTGLGLLGMRERAEALGGTVQAGPGGAGWLVHAELPLDGRG